MSVASFLREGGGTSDETVAHDDPDCQCIRRHGYVHCEGCGRDVLWCRSRTREHDGAELCESCVYTDITEGL